MGSLKIQKIKEDDEVGRIIKQEITDEFCKNYILVGEEATSLSEHYAEFAESIKNFEVRNSDVIVASYPKTGTTWTQEMVWLIANGCDFRAAEKPLLMRFPFLELCTLRDVRKFDETLGETSPECFRSSIEFTSKLDNPRFIKTHLPFSLLPDEIRNGSRTPKIIYTMRNPKDVCVSYLHHGNLFQGWRTNIENFAKVFLADKAMYGSFWKHIFGYWKRRNEPNYLSIKYEDMKADLPSVIKRVAKFLNRELTDEQIEQLCEHLSFKTMKQNKALNAEVLVERLKKHNLVYEDGAFIRSGIVGKYKEEMSLESIKKFDVWIKENTAGSNFVEEYGYNL